MSSSLDILILVVLLVKKGIFTKDEVNDILSASVIKKKLIEKSIISREEFSQVESNWNYLIPQIRLYLGSSDEERIKIIKSIQETLDERFVK